MRLYLSLSRELRGHMDAGLPLLTPCRQALARRAPRPEEALRRLTAGLLLRRVLGVSRDEDLIVGPYGKPALARGGPHFSLSYAGERVLLSVAPTIHGADMEPVTFVPPALVRRCLTPEEFALWRTAPDPDDLFCRFWTGKESLMKATGLGMRLAPDRLGLPSLSRSDRAEIVLDGRRWFVRGLSGDGCRISLARPDDAPPPEPVFVCGRELLTSPASGSLF